MVDRRRSARQRAYRLPGWFFLLTGALSALGLAIAAWVLVTDPFGGQSGVTATPQPTPSVGPTSSGPVGSDTVAEDSGDLREGVVVAVLNATAKPGLAADVATAAEDAGWKVGKVGNWPYPAAQNAVFYPEGLREAGELLGDDLGIKSVRPVRPGMSTTQLTVLLLNAP